MTDEITYRVSPLSAPQDGTPGGGAYDKVDVTNRTLPPSKINRRIDKSDWEAGVATIDKMELNLQNTDGYFDDGGGGHHNPLFARAGRNGAIVEARKRILPATEAGNWYRTPEPFLDARLYGVAGLGFADARGKEDIAQGTNNTASVLAVSSGGFRWNNNDTDRQFLNLNFALANGGRLVIVAKAKRANDQTYPNVFTIKPSEQSPAAGNANYAWLGYTQQGLFVYGKNKTPGQIFNNQSPLFVSGTWAFYVLELSMNNNNLTVRVIAHNQLGLHGDIVERTYNSWGETVNVSIGGDYSSNVDRSWDDQITDIATARVSRALTNHELQTITANHINLPQKHSGYKTLAPFSGARLWNTKGQGLSDARGGAALANEGEDIVEELTNGHQRWRDNDQDNQWLISPRITLKEGERLVFTFRARRADDTTYPMPFGISTEKSFGAWAPLAAGKWQLHYLPTGLDLREWGYPDFLGVFPNTSPLMPAHQWLWYSAELTRGSGVVAAFANLRVAVHNENGEVSEVIHDTQGGFSGTNDIYIYFGGMTLGSYQLYCWDGDFGEIAMAKCNRTLTNAELQALEAKHITPPVETHAHASLFKGVVFMDATQNKEETDTAKITALDLADTLRRDSVATARVPNDSTLQTAITNIIKDSKYLTAGDIVLPKTLADLPAVQNGEHFNGMSVWAALKELCRIAGVIAMPGGYDSYGYYNPDLISVYPINYTLPEEYHPEDAPATMKIKPAQMKVESGAQRITNSVTISWGTGDADKETRRIQASINAFGEHPLEIRAEWLNPTQAGRIAEALVELRPYPKQIAHVKFNASAAEGGDALLLDLFRQCTIYQPETYKTGAQALFLGYPFGNTLPEIITPARELTGRVLRVKKDLVGQDIELTLEAI